MLPREIQKLPKDLSRFLQNLLDNPNLNVRFVGQQIPLSPVNYMDKILKFVTYLERLLQPSSVNSSFSRERNDLLLKLIQREIYHGGQSLNADLVVNFTKQLNLPCQTPVVTVNSLRLMNGVEARNFFRPVLNRENFSNGFLQLFNPSTNLTLYLRFQLMTRKYLSRNVLSMRATELGLLRLLVNDSTLLKRFLDKQPDDSNSSSQGLSLFKLSEYFSYGFFKFLQNRYINIRNLNPLWSIQIKDLSKKGRGIRSQISGRRGTKDFCADPFLWEFDGKMYCFFEYFDSTLKLGKISYVCLEDGDSGDISDALVEDFHLSFPYLFEFQGGIYLCPETSSINEIRIYRCLDFPSQWEYSETIMKDVSAADTVLFEDKGIWWMLTNIDFAGIGDHSIFLNAFYADSPISTYWTPHPNNPIHTSASCARNAGFIQTPEGLFRASQSQAFNFYGKSAALHKVLTLNKSKYSEAEVVIPKEVSREKLDAFHHIDIKGQVLAFDCIIKRSSNYG